MAAIALSLAGPVIGSTSAPDDAGGSVRLGVWLAMPRLGTTVAVSSWRGRYGLGFGLTDISTIPSRMGGDWGEPYPITDVLLRYRGDSWLRLPLSYQVLTGIRWLRPIGPMAALGVSWDIQMPIRSTRVLIGILGSTEGTSHALDAQAQLAGQLGQVGWHIGWRQLATTGPSTVPLSGPTIGMALPL